MRRPFDVLVTDLDRTFTTEGLDIDPAALAAAQDARLAGVRCVLATGRNRRQLLERPELHAAFDGYVLEAGALWGRWDDLRPTVSEPALLDALWAAAAAVEEAGWEADRGECCFSSPRAAEETLREGGWGARVSLQPNRDRVDVLPAGVDKGVGLRLMLASLGADRSRTVAIGDGENDRCLLQCCGHGVAVANAEPGLRAVADEVAPLPASQGFRWLVAQRVLAGGN